MQSRARGRRGAHRGALALAAVAAGCGTPSGAGERSPEAAPRVSDDSAARSAVTAALAPEAAAALASAGVVAQVDGVSIGAGAAFRLLLLSVPDEANNAVRQLVLDRLAAGEAAAHGITVPPAVVERELSRLLAEQERKVAAASRGARDLAAHVKATWGIEPPSYVALVRATLERSLLLERAVLHELVQHPRVQLRLIRVKDKALAEELAKKLELGADFTALARQHSEDGSARDGGVYPPLPTDLPSPLFEQTADLAPGARSPVHEVATADGPRWRIVEVLARLPPDQRPPAERTSAIEALLDGRAVAPPELEAWMRIMEARHEIRFLGLEGEANG